MQRRVSESFLLGRHGFLPVLCRFTQPLQGSQPGFGVLTPVQMEGKGSKGEGSAEASLPDQTGDWPLASRKDGSEGPWPCRWQRWGPPLFVLAGGGDSQT